MDLSYLPGEQVPSGEYQGLPEPPAPQAKGQPAEAPLGGVNELEALRWAFHYLRSLPADRQQQQGDTMSYPEVS